MSDLEELNVPFVFTARPDPLAPDLRPDWRLAVLVLILKYSRRNRASLSKLHVLNWALRSTAARRRLSSYLNGERGAASVLVRFEPGLAQALDYAIGERLLSLEGGKIVELTEKGMTLANEVRVSGALAEEIGFLEETKDDLLEKNITALLDWSAVP